MYMYLLILNKIKLNSSWIFEQDCPDNNQIVRISVFGVSVKCLWADNSMALAYPTATNGNMVCSTLTVASRRIPGAMISGGALALLTACTFYFGFTHSTLSDALISVGEAICKFCTNRKIRMWQKCPATARSFQPLFGSWTSPTNSIDLEHAAIPSSYM